MGEGRVGAALLEHEFYRCPLLMHESKQQESWKQEYSSSVEQHSLRCPRLTTRMTQITHHLQVLIQKAQLGHILQGDGGP